MALDQSIVRLLMLKEAAASVALSHDPDCQTITINEESADG